MQIFGIKTDKTKSLKFFLVAYNGIKNYIIRETCRDIKPTKKHKLQGGRYIYAQPCVFIAHAKGL